MRLGATYVGVESLVRQRKQRVYSLGATIASGQHSPMFTGKDGTRHIIPRMNVHSRPGTDGYNILKSEPMLSFINDMEFITKSFFFKMKNEDEWCNQRYDEIRFAEKNIPKEIKIGNFSLGYL